MKLSVETSYVPKQRRVQKQEAEGTWSIDLHTFCIYLVYLYSVSADLFCLHSGDDTSQEVWLN